MWSFGDTYFLIEFSLNCTKLTSQKRVKQFQLSQVRIEQEISKVNFVSCTLQFLESIEHDLVTKMSQQSIDMMIKRSLVQSQLILCPRCVNVDQMCWYCTHMFFNLFDSVTSHVHSLLHEFPEFY